MSKSSDVQIDKILELKQPVQGLITADAKFRTIPIAHISFLGIEKIDEEIKNDSFFSP